MAMCSQSNSRSASSPIRVDWIETSLYKNTVVLMIKFLATSPNVLRILGSNEVYSTKVRMSSATLATSEVLIWIVGS
jgi:hypothetical protein